MGREQGLARKNGTTGRFREAQLPAYLIDRLAEREATLDYDALSARFRMLLAEIEPIQIPSPEMWEGLLTQASLGLPFDYPYFWALHFYGGTR
jgi:hypothetical protein